jgi:hypothetical protein
MPEKRKRNTVNVLISDETFERLKRVSVELSTPLLEEKPENCEVGKMQDHLQK